MDLAGQAGCPSLIKPSKKDLIEKAFGHLSNTPDESIPGGMDYDGLPCPKKGCRGCKGPNCRNENNNNNNNNSHGEPSNTITQATWTTKHDQPTLKFSTVMSKATMVSSQTRNSVHPTSSTSSSSVMSSIAPVSTLGCKGMAAIYASGYEETPSDVPRRRTYPIGLHRNPLEVRAPKSVKACNMDLAAFKYPSLNE